jgi:hypothetical protein
MAETSADEHRRHGVALFNGAWELIDARSRTPDDDVEMLLRAAASRWHWGRIGGPEELATGDWQVAHVASLLGLADLARLFARRNLDIALAHGWSGWRLASAHEGMARAYAVSGDADGRARHVEQATAALEDEPDDESRDLIESQLASVPHADQGR